MSEIFGLGEYVPSRGTVIYDAGGIVVFSRKGLHGFRFFDIVDYRKESSGHQIGTYMNVKEAKRIAKDV